jgi:hypothetical protein
MTSPDGITWTTRASAANNGWLSVTWSSELGLLVAVSISGTGDRIMTSPDGINWTTRASAADNNWKSITWSSELGLFVAVSDIGTGDRVMTSQSIYTNPVTIINRSISETTSDYITSTTLSNDPVVNPSYSKYSSIVMYGFNDVRNNKVLYGTFFPWGQSILATALTLASSQSKIIDARTFTTSGAWTDNPAYQFGRITSNTGNFIERVINTPTRYIGIRFTNLDSGNPNWQISVNGIERARHTRTTSMDGEASANFTASGVIVDLGETFSTCTLRITNLASIGNQYVDFAVCWNDTDIGRPTMFCSIPRFNYDFTGGAPFSDPNEMRRIFMNETIEQVCQMCKNFNLPVSFFKISELNGNMSTNLIEPHRLYSKKLAKDFLKYAFRR